MNEELVKIERALISVSDKTGIDIVAKKLQQLGVEIISTGGTEKYLKDLGIDITPIKDITGNPEVFSGRMKSLSFQVSSGLLYRRNSESDINDAEKLGIKKIDLVICNLYPFDKQCKDIENTDELVELIDVGGPTMIRSGAKNFEWVTVCSNPDLYGELEHDLDRYDGHVTSEFRIKSALEAFRLLGNYDSTINLELSKRLKNDFSLRYGENPHQSGFVIAHKKGMLAGIKPLQGKKLSYNNYLDADSAISVARDLATFAPDKFGVAIIKHQNPCGVALSENCLHSLELGWEGDSISSFGSVIAFTHRVDKKIADWLSDKFVEVLIAPNFTSEALDIFQRKKNLRVIEYDFIETTDNSLEIRTIDGGIAVQDRDNILESNLFSVTNSVFPEDLEDLAKFSIITAKHLRSNAISLVRYSENGLQLIGAGMGNPNRLVSVGQAISKAKENGVTDFGTLVLASDAFFPFADSVEKIGLGGIKYIVQPGGSIKDKEVIEECNRRKMGMVFTKVRHFKH